MIRRWWIYLPDKHKRTIFFVVAMTPTIAYSVAELLLPQVWPWVNPIAITSTAALIILFAVS